MEELKKKSVVVLPLLVENCDIPPLIADKKYADFRQSYEAGLMELLKRFQNLANIINNEVLKRGNIKFIQKLPTQFHILKEPILKIAETRYPDIIPRITVRRQILIVFLIGGIITGSIGAILAFPLLTFIGGVIVSITLWLLRR